MSTSSTSTWPRSTAGLESTPGRQTSVMYITIDGTNPALDPSGDGTYPVIRLINASKLSAPITFATNHPLYVQATTTMILFGTLRRSWVTRSRFSRRSGTTQTTRPPTQIRPTAADTDIYAAILAEHSGTPCDHEVCGMRLLEPVRRGGWRNFPRFLEDWNPEILMFRGSLVSLTFSQQSTGLWGNGPYYRPPVRDWEFDMRFDNPVNMPPGTPVVGNVIHTAFRPVLLEGRGMLPRVSGPAPKSGTTSYVSPSTCGGP